MYQLQLQLHTYLLLKVVKWKDMWRRETNWLNLPEQGETKSPTKFSIKRQNISTIFFRSLVTWDSEARLSIDPSIIGSSIESYLVSEKLGKLVETDETSIGIYFTLP